LSEFQLLILVGAAEPVAFFAYPGKPSRLATEGTQVIQVGNKSDDLVGALRMLAEELGVDTEPPAVLPMHETMPLPTGQLDGDAVSAILAMYLPEEAIVCYEGNLTGKRLFACSEQSAPHDFLSVTGGSLGCSLPLAVGASIACPNRKVIAFVSDGSALYVPQALWTHARENLDVLTIILANRSYAILLGELQNLGVNQVGQNASRMMSLSEPAPDWVKIAGGLGVDATSVRTCEEFSEVLSHSLRRHGPILIECLI
jgi:acetolactate synthase-1/2/3 large subunit